MTRKLIVLLCAMTLLSACAGPQFKWADARKIKTGMTTDEVTQIMGEPNAIFSQDGKLLYTWSSVGMCKGSRAVRIEFKDDKVTDAPAVPKSFKD